MFFDYSMDKHHPICYVLCLTLAGKTFHMITQKSGETIEQFATRLRQAVRDCDFGGGTDNQIRVAILCTMTYVRRKLLE